MGCEKLILVGQDLAYIEGQCYSKDSAYKDLICGINPETNAWEIMAKDFDAFVDAINKMYELSKDELNQLGMNGKKYYEENKNKFSGKNKNRIF